MINWIFRRKFIIVFDNWFDDIALPLQNTGIDEEIGDIFGTAPPLWANRQGKQQENVLGKDDLSEETIYVPQYAALHTATSAASLSFVMILLVLVFSWYYYERFFYCANNTAHTIYNIEYWFQ